MRINTPLNSIKEEHPAMFAERMGRGYAELSDKEHKKEFGQYLTPELVAEFMAKQYKSSRKRIRILDPGSGTGVLSCALCEQIAAAYEKPELIELTAYEIDENLIPILIESMERTKIWLQKKEISFSYTIKSDDFVLANAGLLGQPLPFKTTQLFDVIISNPPYFKIPKTDARAAAASFVVHGQPNMYAIFMAISAYLLKEDGELIFIVPRSFAAGPYFHLFRERFFSIARPEFIHLFGSRKDAFDRDEVLQEHVILKAKRDDAWSKKSVQHSCLVSCSEGVKDINRSEKIKVPVSEIINMNSRNKFFHIPADNDERGIIHLVNSWQGSFHKYGFEISTGPVVPFRAEDFIIDDENDINKTALLWMQNVKPMSVQWPVSMRKKQYIKVNKESAPLLIANNNYVLLRRFSAKEEQRRLTAAPYLACNFQYKTIGFENHLNYIHKPGGELSTVEAFGLAALLNCGLLDTYFRTFNGNTQVSATELRSIPLPPLYAIHMIGKKAMEMMLSNEDLDKWITDMLMIKRRANDSDEENKRSTEYIESLRIASSTAK